MTEMKMDLAALQREVQRKLGRCMIRLQQYERLLKTMVANMSVEGPLEQLQAVQEQRVTDMRNKTLGTLVKLLTGDHVAGASSDVEVGADEDSRSEGLPTDTVWVSTRITFAMSPEQSSQTKAGLAELVALRNDLSSHAKFIVNSVPKPFIRDWIS
jgi:hypothetical protein